MLTTSFIEAVSDFYEDWTLEDFAELMGLTVYEMLSFLEDHLEDSLASIEATMHWSVSEENDEEDDA